MSLDECMRKAAITGGTVGAVAGAIIGGLLTGPLWFLGAIAGKGQRGQARFILF